MVGMAYNVILNPNQLKPHNLNVVIYGDESVDMDLVDSISKKGILEPIVIPYKSSQLYFFSNTTVNNCSFLY